MPIYKTILRRKEEIADGTMAFHFEKPGGRRRESRVLIYVETLERTA